MSAPSRGATSSSLARRRAGGLVVGFYVPPRGGARRAGRAGAAAAPPPPNAFLRIGTDDIGDRAARALRDGPGHLDHARRC